MYHICSAERPQCNECSRRAINCEYDTGGDETPGRALKRKFADLENQATIYEKVYSILGSRTQQEADAVLRRIRSGEDPESIIRHVQHGDLLLQLRVVPESRYRYEFPFRITLPKRLRITENPYLSSLIYEWETRYPPDPPQHLRQPSALPSGPERAARVPTPTATSASVSESTTTHSRLRDEPGPGPYVKPYHAAEVYDNLLDSCEPSRWTTVSSDNNVLRSLLRAYFLHEYQWFTAFQKDLFLSDMIATNRRNFCSPLLVNAVLAFACHCHRGIPNRVEFWNPHTLGYQFLTEAKRLWELEYGASAPRLTTIQAALILNVVYNLNAMVALGWKYTEEAIRMARKINLFKKPANWETMDPRLRAGRDFTAWALFSWQSHCTYHLGRVPLLHAPPEMPLPEDASGSWYGEIWLKYPLEDTLYRSYCGDLLKAKTEFRIILNEISFTCFGGTDLQVMPPRDKVARLYSRLQAWYANLPNSLLPKNIVFTGQMKLHMHYHHVIITMLRPLLDAPAPSTSLVRTSDSDSTTNQAPRNRLAISNILNSDHDIPSPSPPPEPALRPPIQPIITEARVYYETLLRLYYLRHGFEGLDAFIMMSLLTISFITMDEIKSARHSPSPFERPAESIRSSLVSTSDDHDQAAHEAMDQDQTPRQRHEDQHRDDGDNHLDSLRSTLVLCAKGLYEQGRNYYLAQTMFKLVRNGMENEEIELLRGYATLPEDLEKESGDSSSKSEAMREKLAHRLWPQPKTSANRDVARQAGSGAGVVTAEAEQDEDGEENTQVLDVLLREYGDLRIEDSVEQQTRSHICNS
ncbi:hypothetical protein QBC35DRAFT_495907 [Podospora australis]|uniref:Xylanolytic transcriptional activator regulatory domain-containing protein n=1 Tax=Podospora australis TaxID=1536484 RepID=A0AAN6WZ18_9PEZI|nr:hypothetical protein QBC35DRAFT_495907 [Podospora australis]